MSDDRRSERRRLVQAIEADVQQTRAQTGFARLEPRIREALLEVPRHRFVTRDQADRAYVNRALGIGHGQTISQPFIVALMTQLLDPKPGDRILEVGTGSGYQMAILAAIGATVYGIERVPALAEQARRRVIDQLGYTGIQVRVGNGFSGWPEAAPFDGILVTAAPETLPPRLVEQLRPGGHLVVPLGPTQGPQHLTRVSKAAEDSGPLRHDPILPVAFVPLVDETPTG